MITASSWPLFLFSTSFALLLPPSTVVSLVIVNLRSHITLYSQPVCQGERTWLNCLALPDGSRDCKAGKFASYRVQHNYTDQSKPRLDLLVSHCRCCDFTFSLIPMTTPPPHLSHRHLSLLPSLLPLLLSVKAVRAGSDDCNFGPEVERATTKDWVSPASIDWFEKPGCHDFERAKGLGVPIGATTAFQCFYM